MIRALSFFALVASVALVVGCKQEPTIVIKFEPNDLSGRKPVDMAKPADMTGGGAANLGKATASAGKASGKKKTAECKVAADCVLAPVDCCDCANGGKQHAIPKKEAAAAKAAHDQRCKAAMCTMMLSTDPSCGMRADCVDGACAMVKKK